MWKLDLVYSNEHIYINTAPAISVGGILSAFRLLHLHLRKLILRKLIVASYGLDLEHWVGKTYPLPTFCISIRNVSNVSQTRGSWLSFVGSRLWTESLSRIQN